MNFRIVGAIAAIVVMLSLVACTHSPVNIPTTGGGNNPGGGNNGGGGNGGNDGGENGGDGGGGGRSHNMGLNCLNCHAQGTGEGENIFTVAGTVYTNASGTNTNPGVVVKIYSGPNSTGQLLMSIVSDASGNIHTSSPISFANGVYPVITSPSGNTMAMPVPMTNGGCNSTGCHDGTTNPRAWVN